jgi:quinol-cytochrome oxidoreductase complex cytochrome b subunit
MGEWMLRFLRGGDRVSGGTLSRFYGWHVAILPAITTSILVFHLLLVQLKGMSVPIACEDEVRQRQPMRFFPHFALRDLTGWVFALGVLAALAALLPWELGEKADLFAPAYADIRPEWYYVFMFQTLKLVPGGEVLGVEYEAIPIMLFGLAGLLLMLVPFLDRKGSESGRGGGWTIAGVVGLIFVVAMTAWGYQSLVPVYVILLTALLLSLFAFLTRGPSAAERR